jgi:hypothetical protein
LETQALVRSIDVVVHKWPYEEHHGFDQENPISDSVAALPLTNVVVSFQTAAGLDYESNQVIPGHNK